MRENRTPSGVTLTTIDLGAYGDFMGWGGIIHDGRTYLICTEGVGYDVTDKSESEMLSVWGQSLAQIRETIAKAEKTVKLEDHVRTFGDRLEVNYGLWVRKLS